MGGGAGGAGAYVLLNRLIFLYFSAGCISQRTGITHRSPVCASTCVSPYLFPLLSRSRAFFFIVSRAAHVSIYRIRSTVNAFIKPRERYASGNGRAMGARCVNATQWRRYIFCTVLYESHPWFLLTRGLMEYIKDIEIYIHILNTLTVYTYIHTHRNRINKNNIT